MSIFKSLPPGSNVGDIFKLKPEARRAQGEMGRVIMRGESALSPAERETIAAYVSHLNKCEYCYGGHSQLAQGLGADAAIFETINDDVGAIDIDEKLKPILEFAKKLTLEPTNIGDTDAQAVFDAGWDEQALHDAILVICRFNFMNRLTLGHGLDADPEEFKVRAARMSYSADSPAKG